MNVGGADIMDERLHAGDLAPEVPRFHGILDVPDHRLEAEIEILLATPASSNKTVPGLTTATQYSGLPLPLPMRVSAGFLVYGLSGKMRIHSFPPRLI